MKRLFVLFLGLVLAGCQGPSAIEVLTDLYQQTSETSTSDNVTVVTTQMEMTTTKPMNRLEIDKIAKGTFSSLMGKWGMPENTKFISGTFGEATTGDFYDYFTIDAHGRVYWEEEMRSAVQFYDVLHVHPDNVEIKDGALKTTYGRPNGARDVNPIIILPAGVAYSDLAYNGNESRDRIAVMFSNPQPAIKIYYRLD